MTANAPNGFDRLARVYDRLARLIFGKSIVSAQTCFLPMVPPSSKVLMLGGGTGWLLAALMQLHPECEVWYVESSSKMISLTMEKIKPTGLMGQVHFILGTEKDIPTMGFDVVIADFYLDLFSPSTLHGLVQRIVTVLKPSALWMAADFVNPGKWWQVFLLKAMYWFFRRVCNIEALSLPPWGDVLMQAGLKRVEQRLFYGGFIESVVFRGSPKSSVYSL